MDIKHFENSHKGSFIVEEKGVLLGKMSYGFAGPDKIIIDHTNITEDYRGKGIENQLVNAVILHARKHEIKIVPLCTFTKSLFASDHDVMID